MSQPTSQPLVSRKCQECKPGSAPLPATIVAEMLRNVPSWRVQDGILQKDYTFENHYRVMAFVNAVAWISHKENHHPDMTVGYNKVKVAYFTHSVNGLTENDFICAAKVDAL